MRIGRRRRRSTQTPAGRLNRMNGRNWIVASSPNSNGVTCEDRGGDERDRERADLGAELADGLGGPQPQEVAVARRGWPVVRHGASLAERRSVRRRRAARRPRRASAGDVASSGAHRIGPERLRGPATRRRRPPRGCHRVGAGRPPPRPDERREPQPLGLHDGRRGRPRPARRSSASSRRRSTRSTWTCTPASTRGSGRSTSSRSCRSAPRRWTTASRSPGRSGSGSRPAFDLPVFLYANAATPPGAGQARRRPARPVRGPQGRDRPARARAGLRAGADAPVGRGGRGRGPAVPHRLQHQPRVGGRRAREADRPPGPRVRRRAAEGPGQRVLDRGAASAPRSR